MHRKPSRYTTGVFNQNKPASLSKIIYTFSIGFLAMHAKQLILILVFDRKKKKRKKKVSVTKMPPRHQGLYVIRDQRRSKGNDLSLRELVFAADYVYRQGK